jgi:hypothetical protein
VPGRFARAQAGGLKAKGVVMKIVVQRLINAPIIYPEMDPSIGVNIQGPSLIRVPDWVVGRLGRYYLYFADHKGGYIRLAYADVLTGPWRVHRPGALQLADSRFLVAPPVVSPEELARFEAQYRTRNVMLSHGVLPEITTPHIASPDVHVDAENHRILMYFHGLEAVGHQMSRLAVSTNGIDFSALSELIGRPYMRIFQHEGLHYALAMPGLLSRSADGIGDFEAGPTLFNPNMRHCAVLKQGDELLVFWTQVGDAPESILLSRIDLRGDWLGWRDGPAQTVLRPEFDWEGAGAPKVASMRSTAYGVVNQLRDPAIFQEDGQTYLLYAVGGEAGIAIARLDITPGAR